MGLANLGSESETCVGSRVRLVGVSISFEKNFYRLPFTPPSLVHHIGPSTANAPSPRRGARWYLEYLSCDYTGPRRDVRPPGAVFPIVVNPVRPSPPLQRHAGHCGDISDAVGVHGDGTSPRPPLYRVRTPR
jgi:hypothetical protein